MNTRSRCTVRARQLRWCLALAATLAVGACTADTATRPQMAPAPGLGHTPSSTVSAPATLTTAETPSTAAFSLAPASTITSAAAPASVSVTTRPFVTLRPGARGPDVELAQERLRRAGYDPGPVDGQFGTSVQGALWAFQRVNGLPADGLLSEATMTALAQPTTPTPMRPDGPANRIEVSLSQRLLVAYRDGRPTLISHVSPGSRVPFCENGVCGDAVTPVGDFRVTTMVSGWERAPLGELYNSVYFVPGYAIHGSPSVPDVGASHGCIRIPMHIAEYFPTLVDLGEPIYVMD